MILTEPHQDLAGTHDAKGLTDDIDPVSLTISSGPARYARHRCSGLNQWYRLKLTHNLVGPHNAFGTDAKGLTNDID